MRRLVVVMAAVALALASVVGAADARPRVKHRGAKQAPASAATFTINGAGFGHGVGMSQYGALGFAQHGYDYQQILGHYYQGTKIGTLKPEPTVTVLLKDGALTFTGALSADGYRLRPAEHVGVVAAAGGRLALISAGRRLGSFKAPLTVRSRGSLEVLGLGRYRGSLVLRPDGSGGIETVDAVGLEQYVEGVISAEMPSGWPAQALQAQAVAARTYAVADAPVSADYMVYSDTRSQMYRGVAAETPATDAATAATAGQVVEYAGLPVPTFFFASSGGYTESVQNVWLGDSPVAYLHGVPDPYDDAGGNPYYRWHDSIPMRKAAATLRGAYRGSLVGVKVLKTGVSPRVVSAQVIGTRGSSEVTGPRLQQLFGTMSTYMSFGTLSARSTPSAPPSPAAASGGSGLQADAGRSRATVSGTVFPVRGSDRVTVLLQRGARWLKVASTIPRAGGGYSVTVPVHGVYRVRYGGQDGPRITAG